MGGVDLPLGREQLILVFDEDRNGSVSCAEWCDGIMRLRGTRGDSHTRGLQAHLIERKGRVHDRIAKAEHMVKSCMKDSISRAGWSILHGLDGYSGELDKVYDM